MPLDPMPPPPLPPPLPTTILLLIITVLLPHHLISAHRCSPSPPETSKQSPCPPFTSPPSFPFSTTPGCGHPSFHINCKTPHATISINHLSFSLLKFQPNNSLFLSPLSKPSINCSTSQVLSIPSHHINLTNSPFHVSNYSCSQNCIEISWVEEKDVYFSRCKSCLSKNGVCGFDLSDPLKQFMCFRSKRHVNTVDVLCSIFVFASLLLLLTGTIIIFRSRRLKSMVNEEDPTTLFLHRHRSANLPPVFTYEELESSTNGFDPKRKLGDGGFGSVFLGQLHDGRIVAVKHLHRHHAAFTGSGGRAISSKSFCNEILILSTIDHPNLVKLHGYCSDPRGLLLVYDYVPNGTVADHLHGHRSLFQKSSLTWPVRVDIALQTALAVEYLHFSVQPSIVHRDITSANIFVEKDMRIKVGDFGLSRLLVCEKTSTSSGCVWTGPQGTPGYLDPDYHRSSRLTEKSDVFSLGVVMMELISGMKAVDQNRNQGEVALADLVVSKIQMGQLHQILDPVMRLDDEVVDAVEAVAELAFRCVAADRDDRPDSKEVVAELKRIRGRTRGGEI